MDGKPADGWEKELERWLEPFLGRLRRQAQRRWAPVYLKGLLLPGERKSVEPMAARVAPGDVQQLHHFVSTSPWATAPLEDELVKAADRLVGEHRASGERKYYLTNHPADTPLETPAALIKARWVCEQVHQQMKDELGLDHVEGRSWRGLHHHALLCQLALAFLQHLRLGKKGADRPDSGPPPPRPSLPAVRQRILAALTRVLLRCPHCRQRFDHHFRL